MNDLQKLALRHCIQLAKELDSDAIKLGIKIEHNKEEFNSQNHCFPLAEKARDIGRWSEAIIESEKS